jgi:Fe2+ transport system protein FeoA
MQLRRRQSDDIKEDPCLNSEGIVPLTCVKEGGKAVITHSSGKENVVRRLSEMGLTPGCEIKMLCKCSFHGPVEIEVRGVALALGYELASEIFVQELKENLDAK